MVVVYHKNDDLYVPEQLEKGLLLLGILFQVGAGFQWYGDKNV